MVLLTRAIGGGNGSTAGSGSGRLHHRSTAGLGTPKPYFATVRVRSEENVMRLVTPTRRIGITKSTEDQKEHARQAVRLRSLVNTVTTAATKARVLQQAAEHARLAGHGDPT